MWWPQMWTQTKLCLTLSIYSLSPHCPLLWEDFTRACRSLPSLLFTPPVKLFRKKAPSTPRTPTLSPSLQPSLPVICEFL